MNRLRKAIRSVPGAHKSYRFLVGICNVIRSSTSPFLQRYPAGHYYSPMPDLSRLLEQDRIFKRDSRVCPGVDLREDAQLELLDKLAAYYDELPFPEHPDGSSRYYFENSFFSYGDAIVLYAMLRHFKPKRVIEVGSGFSSAVMLDTNDAFPDSFTRFTFIEPFPDRLNKLIKEEENCELVAEPLQDVGLELFDTLNENDIMFIDSSHVLKAGSDVARIIFEILPRLKAGVIIHFHDIAWPFEYPKEWLIQGRAWNEAYALRAFLQYNNAFDVLYFGSFMGLFHNRRIEEKMPLCLRCIGGGLWLRKAV